MRLRSVGLLGRVFDACRPRASSTTQRTVQLVGILAAMLPIEACGGGTTSGRDSGPTQTDSAVPTNGGDDGGNIADGGPSLPGPDGATQTSWGVPADGGPWSPVCPLSPPGEGTACSQDKLQCEYGDAWWSAGCDQVVECQHGVWQSVAGTPLLNAACEPPPGPNPPSCPPDTGSFQSRTPCTLNQTGLTCFYGQGTSCTCAHPDSGPLWYCGPDPGCSSTRPRVGATCNTTLSCTYASVTELCIGQGGDTVWQIGYQGGGGAKGAAP
jgi:hypothetical protein